MQVADPASEGRSLNATVSQLHVALAKKSSEVEKLRSSLSNMQASSQNPPWQVSRPVHDSETVDKAQQCVSDILSGALCCEVHCLCSLI